MACNVLEIGNVSGKNRVDIVRYCLEMVVFISCAKSSIRCISLNRGKEESNNFVY